MHVYFGTYQKMENREWMYKGRPSRWDLTDEWKEKTVTSQDFIKFWGNFFAFVLLVLIEFS
jgi:hypothetical protein